MDCSKQNHIYLEFGLELTRDDQGKPRGTKDNSREMRGNYREVTTLLAIAETLKYNRM